MNQYRTLTDGMRRLWQRLSQRGLIAAGVVAGCTGLLMAAAMAQAQQERAATTLSAEVKVVTLPVTVRDKRGEIVRGLTKDDFLLEEDGHPQTIKYFEQQSNLPMILGLLVDTSLSQRLVLEQEKSASRSFLAQMLTKPKDTAFVIHFDYQVELLQDLTPAHDKLESALTLLQIPGSDSASPDASGSGGGGSRPSRGGYGTLLYDAIYLASDELMSKQQGRKALIILSDGVDHGSKETVLSAISAAQQAETVVYSILFAAPHQEQGGFGRPPGGGRHGGLGGNWPGGGGSGGGWPGGGRAGGGQRYPQDTHTDGKKILEQVSRETGGAFYEVSKKLTIEEIYTKIAEELRTQYSLGYTPDKANTAAGYHKIHLTTKEKSLTVQTREGYYAEH